MAGGLGTACRRKVVAVTRGGDDPTLLGRSMFYQRPGLALKIVLGTTPSPSSDTLLGRGAGVE